MKSPLSLFAARSKKTQRSQTDGAELQEEQARKTVDETVEAIVRERTYDLEREILEHKKTERLYLEHLELLQHMINMLPLAAVAVNSEGLIVHANDSFHAVFESVTPLSGLKGHPFLTLLRDAVQVLSSPGWQGFLDKLQKREPFSHEIAMADGHAFLCEYVPGSPGYGGQLLLLKDLSEEKRIEAVKAEFMSLASHQLRSPLTSIRWALGRFTRTLRDRLLPEERQLLAKARASAAAMAQTIRTMLSVSRVESGMQHVALGTLPLKNFLRSLYTDFAEPCKTKSIAFSMECADDLMINTDPLILREVMENLLSNAVKYTPEGGSIHIGGWWEGGDVCLEVCDTGFGIPPHQQDRVFTKFFRGDNILHVDTEGSGLGLYLVSKLVDVLRGSISFTSKLKEGTVFLLKFPTMRF